MRKNEEIVVAAVVLLSFAVMLGTALKASDVIAFLFLGAITLAVIVTAGLVSRKRRPEKPDERSARCSLAATRNAFLAAIAQIGIYVALLQLTVSMASTVDVLASIWGVSVGVYLLTYLYCKNACLEKGA
ncbi:MAG: hypothetical protein ACM3RR_00125 [Bacillota bacterium]